MAQAFGAESTTDEVLEGVDLSGRRILVTGTSSGLGVETVPALAARGAGVIGTARDIAKAQRALAHVLPQAPNSTAINLIELKLASLKSVRKAASELLAQAKPFYVIITNAGVMACPHCKTQASLPGEDAVLLLLYGLLRNGQIVLRRFDGRNDLPKPKTQLKAALETIREHRLTAELANVPSRRFSANWLNLYGGREWKFHKFSEVTSKRGALGADASASSAVNRC